MNVNALEGLIWLCDGNFMCTTKGFTGEGQVKRVEIEEDVRIVKWSSKFIKIKLFRIL